jgi:hypothetical protein
MGKHLIRELIGASQLAVKRITSARVRGGLLAMLELVIVGEQFYFEDVKAIELCEQVRCGVRNGAERIFRVRLLETLKRLVS